MNGKHSKSIPGHNSKKDLFLKESYERKTLQKHPWSQIKERVILLKRVMKGQINYKYNTKATYTCKILINEFKYVTFA